MCPPVRPALGIKGPTKLRLACFNPYLCQDIPGHIYPYIFFTGLPESEGITTILTVVDRFSKMANFIPLAKLPSAKETAEVILSHIFKLHGLPVNIVSDRGP